MSKNKFKPGQFVYWPSRSNSPLELYRNTDSSNKDFPILLDLLDSNGLSSTVYSFTEDGKQAILDKLPSLFPANYLTKFSLELLYDIELKPYIEDNKAFIEELKDTVNKIRVNQLIKELNHDI